LAQRKITKETAALAALTNLGPASAAWLVAAGVKTPARLRALGAVETYRRVAFSRGGSVTYNLLYALEGAIRGRRWDYLPESLRAHLRRRVYRDRK
jgi:DNA transformation protein